MSVPGYNSVSKPIQCHNPKFPDFLIFLNNVSKYMSLEKGLVSNCFKEIPAPG